MDFMTLSKFEDKNLAPAKVHASCGYINNQGGGATTGIIKRGVYDRVKMSAAGVNYNLQLTLYKWSNG